MRRPRSERMPAGQSGVWHIVSRCVRRARLLEKEGRREWLCSALAGWLDLLAVDLLGYALMGNHIHMIVRTRPDLAAEWSPGQVRRRQMAASMVADGHPGRNKGDTPNAVRLRIFTFWYCRLFVSIWSLVT